MKKITLHNLLEKEREHLEIEREKSNLISHSGEKGRNQELALIKNFLEPRLPKRFSIGSGFVAANTGELSSQLDIIIYDNLFNAPLHVASGYLVLPIECVYAVIEVKTTCNKAEIRKSLAACEQLRKLAKEILYLSYSIWDGCYVRNKGNNIGSLSPRFYVFSYDGSKPKIRTLRELSTENTHLHGLYISSEKYFCSQVEYKGKEFVVKEEFGLHDFLLTLIDHIFPLQAKAADIHAYFPEKS